MKRTFAVACLLLLGGCNLFIDPDSVPLPTVRLTIVKAGSGFGLVTSDPPGITCGSECTATFPPGTHVTLHASTTNGSDSFFTGFSGFSKGGCVGPMHHCNFTISKAIDVTANFPAMNSNLIFVSSRPFPMNLGSATAYDAECNTLATAANINDASGTSYVAAVSDRASLFTARLGGSARGWVRMDGLPFADSQSSLFTSNVVFNTVKYDENGNSAPNNTYYFTGTNFDGTLASSDTCNNWTTTASSASVIGGSVASGPFAWLAGASGDCATDGIRILCMGKTKDSAVSPTPSVGRKVWLTNTPFTVGGGTTPDQLCDAHKPAGVSAAAALIATTTRPASRLLVSSMDYVRPDGTLVGTGETLSVRGPLSSGIWQSGDLVYRLVGGSSIAWTGAADPDVVGDTSSTCGDWVDSAQTAGRVGSYLHTSSTWWTLGTQRCSGTNSGRALYCVQTAP